MKKTYILLISILTFFSACQKDAGIDNGFGKGSGAFRLEKPSVQSETEIPVIVTKVLLVWNLPHFRSGSINRVRMVHIRNT